VSEVRQGFFLCSAAWVALQTASSFGIDTAEVIFGGGMVAFAVVGIVRAACRRNRKKKASLINV